MKALIVDDSMINLKVASKLLLHEGVEAQTVLSGKECLEEIKNNKYDIIFMDIMMPEMDGVEVFHHLRENPDFSIPVIALTADAKTGAKEKYLELGFDGYLAKPIHLEELRTILDQIRK